MTVSTEGPALPIVRAADLHTTSAQSPWLIDSLWARAGLGILGGAPKCCKSWFGLELALSVASGTPCLDTSTAHDPGAALIYLAGEASSPAPTRPSASAR